MGASPTQLMTSESKVDEPVRVEEPPVRMEDTPTATPTPTPEPSPSPSTSEVHKMLPLSASVSPSPSVHPSRPGLGVPGHAGGAESDHRVADRASFPHGRLASA